jgi:hypothetical protein
MPDLIIKPTNTQGNRVIIQDQAGGAVLTTADSGATLGNSTQDNITRLGTVTAGNLSNSAIVYPSGHIVAVTSHTSTADFGISGGTVELETDSNDITVSCTAGNHLHITISGGYVFGSGSGFYIGVGMVIKESGQSDVAVNSGGMYQRSDGGAYDNEILPCYNYSHTAVTTSVTIKASLRNSSSATSYWQVADIVGKGRRKYLIMESQS